MLQTCHSRRERDLNPRAIARKLISSKWECVPDRTGSYLKYADFWGIFAGSYAVYEKSAGKLRDGCETVLYKTI